MKPAAGLRIRLNQCKNDSAKKYSWTDEHGIKHYESVKAKLSDIDRAELHVHMNGSIPLSTIQDIFADELTELPAGFLIERDRLRCKPYHSLASYLTPWQVLRLFPEKCENLNLLSLAVFESLSHNNVRFVELRSSVLYLASLQNCVPAQALERLLESSRSASRRFGIRTGLILTVTRGYDSSVALSTLLQAYQDLGQPSDVWGWILQATRKLTTKPNYLLYFVRRRIDSG